MKTYNPQSHFFTELSKLVDSTDTDGFGPVFGAEANKFRVTSKVKSNVAGAVKLYAICGGQVMIQPQDDATKINIIIKPSQNNYAPLKIKYFIYRGVNKSDYFTGTTLNQPDSGKPEVLNKMWTYLMSFNALSSTTGISFPTESIYQHAAPSTKLIDSVFQTTLVTCKEGEYIGNFTDEVGLDIVLDHGDFTQENSTGLFDFDLKFARAKEFIFDVSSSALTSIQKKRLKENIHQFLDAAAFWGSHINCGTITLNDGSKKTDMTGIGPILKKYYTGSNLYIYLQGENNRSFNYYDNTKKIYGFVTSGELNDFVGWPILIKQPAAGNNLTVNFEIDYKIDNSNYNEEDERSISIDLIATNNTDLSSFPVVEKPVFTGQLPNQAPTNKSGKTKAVKVVYPSDTNGFYSNFTFLNCRTSQKFPKENYFNHLWAANIKTSTGVDPTINEMYWMSYDKSRNVDLYDTIGESAIIQNKVVFDTGKKKTGGSTSTKQRRLFTAIIKNNSGKTEEKNSLNVDKVSSGYVGVNTTVDIYNINLFNDSKFSIYRGTFKEGSTVMNSLSVVNEESVVKKYSYMFLGITEDQYSLFAIPVDADNVFFNLEEQTPAPADNVRKFKLGLRYENNAGDIIVNYPSSGSIYVYTLDGLFFFSSDFSDYQTYYNEYPKSVADFRVKLPYGGEFGFDWMRVGDTSASGDVNYQNIVGKLYKEAVFTNVVDDVNQSSGFFRKDPKMFDRMEKDYSVFPIQPKTNNTVDKYYVPSLNIYPPHVTGGIDLDSQAIFGTPYDSEINRTAKLSLKVQVTSRPSSISLVYDTTKLNITTDVPLTRNSRTYDVEIKAKVEFNTPVFVKVVAQYDKPKIIGLLKVNPNHKIKRFSKKILFVDVITNLNAASVDPPLRFTLQTHSLNLKKFLRQGFCTPIIDVETMNVKSDTTFNSSYVYTDSTTLVKSILGYNSVTPITPVGNVVDYLYAKLKTTPLPSPLTGTIGNKYDDHFKIFMFHEKGGDIDDNGAFEFLSGYSGGPDKLVDFPNDYPSTSTHEFLHTAGVQHSFTAFEANKNAKYTYQNDKTNNIMDYSDLQATGAFATISLYDWQVKIAQTKLDSEP